MRRLLTAAAMAWLPAAITAVTWAAWSAELPGQLATHWNGTGSANGYSATTTFGATLLVIGILAGCTALAAAVTAARADRGAPPSDSTSVTAASDQSAARRAYYSRFVLAAAGSVGGAAAGIWVATATATLANPADARLGAGFLYFLMGLAWGVAVWAVAGRAAYPLPELSPAGEPLDLSPTERAAYTTTLRSPLITAVLGTGAAVVVVVALTLDAGFWLVALVPLAAAIVFGRIRLTVDRRGLRLVAGLIGVTVKHIPLAEIVSAGAQEINPVEWGGWGYRVVPGRSALVLRAGPGLVLYLTDGRRFAVTLDRPQTPAALITALQTRIHN
ncbi:hypothetical protein AB0M02_20695 [Actinoplanes sp. NPDC051861]|uniref:hypothetical protein n=1 Tax=Actinoplanes sp. NPDC051861 TaxID=3155170 RepID=UPI0034278DD7